MAVMHFAIRYINTPGGKPFYKMLCGGASSDSPRTFDPEQVTCLRCQKSMRLIGIEDFRTAKLAGATDVELEPLRAMLHARALETVEQRKRTLEYAEEAEKELRLK